MENVALESLVLRRVFPVSPEKVWRAWFDAEALRDWLGQAESPDWRADMDARVGGGFCWVMREPDGRVYEARGVYRELVPNRRLAFTWTWMEGVQALITVELNAVAGGTELVFTLDPVADPREPDAWRADFKRLGKLLMEKQT
jgi:uncharacterized protein YndB with AHSA1/START domain